MKQDEFEDLLLEESLSGFCQLPVQRSGDKAYIVVAYLRGDKRYPVLLAGYTGSSTDSDFNILEAGWEYFQSLRDELR